MNRRSTASLVRDGRDWWISGMEGNGSADCSSKQDFLSLRIELTEWLR
jgi:hypothetical protein